MNSEELFGANLPLIERVISAVCRRAGVRGADAEDFASTAKLALIDDDYAILRAYERRSSLATFLTPIVQRLLAREQTRRWGRWRSSATAERCGPAAVLLEKLLRDGRSVEEAAPFVRAIDPSLETDAVRDLAARLPRRASRPQFVPLADGADVYVAPDRADARTTRAEARKISERAGRVVRETLASLSHQDRTLLRLRFGAGLSIADAARLLGIPQRPLYRRIEALLRQLRLALEREQIDAAMIDDIIGADDLESLDFDLSFPGLRRPDAVASKYRT